MRYLTARMLMAMVALAGVSAAGAGDIYCNNQGHDCSDRPTPGSVFVRAQGEPRAATQAPATAAAERVSGDTPAPPADARLKQEATRQAVQKDVGSTHAEQCKQAQDKYQKSIEARRIFRTGKDGEREYLSDNEIDQERLNARLAMEQVCGKGG